MADVKSVRFRRDGRDPQIPVPINRQPSAFNECFTFERIFSVQPPDIRSCFGDLTGTADYAVQRCSVPAVNHQMSAGECHGAGAVHPLLRDAVSVQIKSTPPGQINMRPVFPPVTGSRAQGTHFIGDVFNVIGIQHKHPCADFTEGFIVPLLPHFLYPKHRPCAVAHRHISRHLHRAPEQCGPSLAHTQQVRC